jgi:NAD(P)-dependent dehydrogenase (short-subunit alcohol dehydrogenase family)
MTGGFPQASIAIPATAATVSRPEPLSRRSRRRSKVARASAGTLSAYAASKGAIETLVTHFASALGQRGLRVNAATVWKKRNK